VSYEGKRVLITGGLGFVGSNLALKLVAEGAKVMLIDSMLPLYGGNLFNIDPIQGRVEVSYTDIRQQSSMNHVVRGQDYVFHVAGQVSHVDSMTDPFTDVDINVNGTLVVLEACRRCNPDVKIVFTGTRGQYGPSVRLPVDELAPTNPMGMYAITNLAAEKMVLMYHQAHGIRTTCLRITNTYGPRHQMKHNRYGVLNWFMRLAMDDEVIPLYGDGQILRDYLYVDDLVAALMACGLSEAADGEVFNVGSSQPTKFLELAQQIVAVVGAGRHEYAPFSAERKALEPGDFWCDIGKIKRTVGWVPAVPLSEGLRLTHDYYRANREHYWTRGDRWEG
jgi:UDP-glucose 4-epimerase